jgi:predicted transcriptional regulator
MDLLELTSDLIKAQVAQRNIDHASIDTWLRRTHSTLLGLWENEIAPAAEQPAPSVPVNWRRSIKQKSVTCLECGQTFRQLLPMHLRQHGIDGATYRRRHGMPHGTPLAARESTRQRRQIAASVRPWEYLQPRRERKSRGER